MEAESKLHEIRQMGVAELRDTYLDFIAKNGSVIKNYSDTELAEVRACANNYYQQTGKSIIHLLDEISIREMD